MKKYLFGAICIASFGAQAQLFSNDVNGIVDNLEYTKGLKVKSFKKNDSDDKKWNKNEDLKSNSQIYSTTARSEKSGPHVKVKLTYNDLEAEKPKLTEIYQIVQDKRDDYETTTRVFNATLNNGDSVDASECSVIDEHSKNRKYKCVSVDRALCGKLKVALRSSRLQADDLAKCSKSLQSLSDVVADTSQLDRIKKSRSHRRTTDGVSSKDITSINGNVFGTNSAKKGSVALMEVFHMANLCEKMGLDEKKYADLAPTRKNIKSSSVKESSN